MSWNNFEGKAFLFQYEINKYIFFNQKVKKIYQKITNASEISGFVPDNRNGKWNHFRIVIFSQMISRFVKFFFQLKSYYWKHMGGGGEGDIFIK